MVWLSVFPSQEEMVRFHNPEQLAAFLVGAAKKKVAFQARSRLTRPEHNLNRERPLEELDARDTPQATAMVESPADREQLGQFISALPEPHRQIVELRLKGLTKSEIAKWLGIPDRTLRRFWKKLLRLWTDASGERE